MHHFGFPELLSDDDVPVNFTEEHGAARNHAAIHPILREWPEGGEEHQTDDASGRQSPAQPAGTPSSRDERLQLPRPCCEVKRPHEGHRCAELTGHLADPVQDIYLRELRAYKTPPVRPNDAEGHVHRFSAPRAPASPEEASLANELKEYEEQKVEVEGQVEQGEAAAAEDDWFEADVEEEEENHGSSH
jgi:F-type H+-transporting ATPase subunit h